MYLYLFLNQLFIINTVLIGFAFILLNVIFHQVLIGFTYEQIIADNFFIFFAIFNLLIILLFGFVIYHDVNNFLLFILGCHFMLLLNLINFLYGYNVILLVIFIIIVFYLFIELTLSFISFVMFFVSIN